MCFSKGKILNVALVSIILKCVLICGEECRNLENVHALSNSQLLQYLTHECRYDRLERPVIYDEKNGLRKPIDVFVRVYVYYMQNLEAHDLKFNMHALVQLRFTDPRLKFTTIAPQRNQPILGEKELRDILWMPHVFLANERDSTILGTHRKDILTSLSPDGTVIVSSRVKASLHCWMNLQKFPFDEQHCSAILESWMYNTSEVVLHWEIKRPILFDPALHLTEYRLRRAWHNSSIINADMNDLRHGAFAGNYSSLSFTVHLAREVGFYIMDYFLPSMLIVGMSWVSFWLQADQAPPRIMLGTSTMLTFITLASAQGKTLPKVSYIKVSEVWFLGCTVFIFGSLLEFAFVNTIWRRKQSVDVKKLNSKHILKSTFSPLAARRRHSSCQRSRSFNSTHDSSDDCIDKIKQNNYLTVHSFPIITITEGKTMEMREKQYFHNSNNNNDDSHLIDHNVNGAEHGWTTLTPQEISMWIDAKARFMFPLAFLVFNAFFWSFVYII